MSVYTPVSREQLETFLGLYDAGGLVDFRGIDAGIENSNFFVTTERGEFVLTLFEKHAAHELPFFLNLMAHLAEHGVPSPHPIPDGEGKYLQRLNGKPAALVRRLAGESPHKPSLEHCRTVGKALARLHLAAWNYRGYRDNDRGYAWWRAMREILHPRLDEEDARLLDDELRFQSRDRYPDLRRGVIHADLFRDNVMFVGDELTGIIDFYYACNDALLYDLAITVNDWCCRHGGSLDPDRTQALVTAYDRERQLSPVERCAWPLMLRAAALRFWLSRLHDKHFPRPGHITHMKDPDEFKDILVDRIEHASAL